MHGRMTSESSWDVSVPAAQFETLERRQLLSASHGYEYTVLQMPGGEGIEVNPWHQIDLDNLLPQADPIIAAAFARAMDLTQYSPAQLATATEWVFVADIDASPAQLARDLGAALVTPTGVLPGVFVADFSNREFLGEVFDSFGGAQVTAYYPNVVVDMETRLIPNDPFFGNQWHLRNTGQGGGVSGVDANVTSVWDNYRGEGVRIGVVDDGGTPSHADIAPNYNATYSWNFVNNNNTISGGSHGTPVGGVAAARGNNGTGVAGAAYMAQLSFLRLLGATSDTNTANALGSRILLDGTQLRQHLDVYNNSWGPSDSGTIFSGPGPLSLASMQQTAQNGRNGLGGLIVWAGGNGGENDNSNRDGYVASRHTISVAALSNFGTRSSYSERGANHLVAGHSNGGSLGITTTSTTGYTSSFGGTSSASPLVAGVVALIRQSNPNLTYRDIQHVLVNSARKVHLTATGAGTWAFNAAGHRFSHWYGFGAIDAAAAVAVAQTWQNVGAEFSADSGTLAGGAIPDVNAGGLVVTRNVTQNLKVEHVDVIVNVSHARRGQLEFFLTSPSGTTSQLLHVNSDANANINNWTLNSVHFWDEPSQGTWTLRVADRISGTVGSLSNWRLVIHGTQFSTPPSVQSQQFLFQTAQRLQIQFSQNVQASLQGSDLSIQNLTAGNSIGAILLGYNTASNVATFGFNTPSGILPDGNYTAQLTGSVTNASGQEISNRPVLNFYFLQGDVTRDRAVNLADMAVLRGNFGATGATFSQGDLNYDGVVNLADLALLRGAFGNILPAPGSLFGDGGGGGGGGDDVLD